VILPASLDQAARYPVFFSDPGWHLSGVNTFTAELVRKLRAMDVDARILATDELRSGTAKPARPDDLPVDDVRPAAPRRFVRTTPPGGSAAALDRLCRLCQFLEQNAPCVYVPNYDFEHSFVGRLVSPRVGIVGIVHSDDTRHYRHAAQLGDAWNAAVAVSQAIASRLTRFLPDARRVATIPYGVSVPEEPRCPARKIAESGDAPLKIAYVGRLEEEQKRVGDLVRIAERLASESAPFRLSIIGDGSQRLSLERRLARFVRSGHVRFEGLLAPEQIQLRLQEEDVLLLVSEYEGLPLALLEAMAGGCVPVVSRVRSGVPEVVEEGRCGLTVPIGDVEAFCRRLAWLQAHPRQRVNMAAAAHARLRHLGLTIGVSAERYKQLFDRVLREARAESFVRPAGSIWPSPYRRHRAGWRGCLPSKLRSAARSMLDAASTLPSSRPAEGRAQGTSEASNLPSQAR